MAQAQISRTLREEEAVSRIAAIVPQERFDRRSALAGASAGLRLTDPEAPVILVRALEIKHPLSVPGDNSLKAPN